MRWSALPAFSGVLAAGGLDVVGPSKEEWMGPVMAVLALVVREVIWWLMNRKRSSPDVDTTVQGG